MNYILYLIGLLALFYSFNYLIMAQSAIHEICSSLNFLIFIVCIALGYIIEIGNKIYKAIDNTPKEPNKYFKCNLTYNQKVVIATIGFVLIVISIIFVIESF